MLPPSPQSYYPRFHPHASSISNGSLPQNAGRDLPPPQHRPSSSMSISSMLGSEPDRPPLTSVTTSPYHAKPPNSFSEMSPPQNSVNPNPGEYSYKPRSQTPDRMGISNLLGTRPYRSGSGSIMQVSAPCEDSAQASSRAAFQRFGEPMQQPPSQEPTKLVEEPVNHVRTTSISGMLQRPSSQPQPQAHSTFPGQGFQPLNPPQQSRPAWPEYSNSQNRMGFNNSSPPNLGVNRVPEYGKEPQNGQPAQSTTPASTYDIRPPGFNSSTQQQHPVAPHDRDAQPGASAWEPPSSNPMSPGTRPQVAGACQYKPTGGLASAQTPVTNPPPQENQLVASVAMNQQHSSQSHDRSIFGERLDNRRTRLFSPFAGSQISQGGLSASAPPEQSRKGSDELSQHRALLGESKRGGGRYSPLPQAVQGAQAKSLGPGFGIKTEHGRIFSGIGSGVGTASLSPAQGPAGLVAIPFKRDDQSSPGYGKRRKVVKEEEGKATSEPDGSGRVGKKARNHQ